MECETSAMVREMMRRSLSRYAQIVIDGFTLTRSEMHNSELLILIGNNRVRVTACYCISFGPTARRFTPAGFFNWMVRLSLYAAVFTAPVAPICVSIVSMSK